MSIFKRITLEIDVRPNSGKGSRTRTVEPTVGYYLKEVPSLAVHRAYSQTKKNGKGWKVTHIASGFGVSVSVPLSGFHSREDAFAYIRHMADLDWSFKVRKDLTDRQFEDLGVKVKVRALRAKYAREGKLDTYDRIEYEGFAKREIANDTRLAMAAH